MTADFYIAFLRGQQTHSIVKDAELLEAVKRVGKMAVDFDAYAIELKDRTVIVAYMSNFDHFNQAAISIEMMFEEAAYAAQKRGITCLNVANFYPRRLNQKTLKTLGKCISIKFENK